MGGFRRRIRRLLPALVSAFLLLTLAAAVAQAQRPSKPSNVQATAGDGQVTLTWDAQPNQGITRWGYQAKSSGAQWSARTLYVLGTGATTSTVVTRQSNVSRTALVNGTAYVFRVRASRSTGKTAPGPMR